MTVSLGKREAIIELHRLGCTQRRIGTALRMDHRTIGRIIQLYKSTCQLTPRKSPGRPPRLTARERRYLARKLRTNPKSTPSKLAQELTQNEGIKIHPKTIRRALHKEGLKAFKKPRKPYLSPSQRKLRLKFAQEYSKKPPNFWKQVVFSDESPFQIFPSSGGQWTWRRPGERFLPGQYVETVKHGGGTIHIWGCMTFQGVGWMCRLDQGLDGPTYITILEDELQQTLKKYFPRGKQFIFQQDGCSVHRCKVVKEWFEKKKMAILPWPAQSPDLNPIEHLWADVKRRIMEKHAKVSNKEQLWSAIEEEWEATPKETVRTLYESIPGRLQAVIQAKGGVTKY